MNAASLSLRSLRLAQGGKAWPKLSDHISLVIIIRSLRSPDLRIIIFNNNNNRQLNIYLHQYAPCVAELQPFHDCRQTCHRINKLVRHRHQLTPSLLVLFFVRSASRVSFFSWSLASSVSSNTCLCLCGWNLYPDTSASVK